MLKEFLMMSVLLVPVSFAEDFQLHDPTAPLVGMSFSSGANDKSPIEDLKLQAIMRGNGRTRAIVNGKTCYIAEECFGYKVYAINKSDILLKKDNNPSVVRLSLFTSKVQK